MENEQLEKIIEDIPKFFEADIQKTPPSTNLFEGNADVYRGSFKLHKNVVIKIWRGAADKSSPNYRVSAREAATMFKHSHHDNIVRFFGVLIGSQKELKGVVTEYMAGGDLSKAIHNKTLVLSHGLRMHWIVQAGYALQYLHGKSIAHRDLKPQNMLLCGNLEKLKLCDFGLTKEYSTDWSTTGGGAGTYFYMAPERIDKTKYGKEQFPLTADIFSMSITIWEILTREHPAHNDIAWHDLANSVLKGGRPDISRIQDSQENKEIRDFIQRGWDGAPQHRPSIDELVGLFEKEKSAANYDEMSTTNNSMSPRACLQSTTSSESRVMTTRQTLSRVSIDLYNVLRGWDLVSPSLENSLTGLAGILNNIKTVGMIFITSEVGKENEKLEEQKNRLYSHVLESYKDYCKKTMEEVWIAEDLDRMNALEEEIQNIHNRLLDLIQQAEPSLLKCPEEDREQAEKWFKEVTEFIQERKENYEDVSAFIHSCNELTEQAEACYSNLRRVEYEQLSEKISQLKDDFVQLDGKQRSNEQRYMRYSNGQLEDRLERVRNILEQIDEKFKDLLKKFWTAVDSLSDGMEQCTRLYRKLSNQPILEEKEIYLLAEEITNDYTRLEKQRRIAEDIGGHLQKMGLDISNDLNDDKRQKIRQQLKQLGISRIAVTNVAGKLKKIQTVQVNLPTCSILEKGPEDTKTKYRRVSEELKEVLLDSKTEIPYCAYFSKQLSNALKEKQKPLEEEIKRILHLNDNVAKLFDFTGWPE